MADFSNSSSIATYLSLLNVCAKFDYHTNCILFFLTGASMGLFKCFTV
ncbi:hypothetical protein HanHA300_Chr05g0167761 [Helianthus annuus]|nr:hypothetical protein HanHA300_Chr05g0167761 [Helianthus annuus]KAJ0583883.1 hypothetical protein HanHA89_Chr05g0181831 [Helianthus annuus]